MHYYMKQVFALFHVILGSNMEECLLSLLHSHDGFLHSSWQAKTLSITNLKFQFSLIEHTSLTGGLHSDWKRLKNNVGMQQLQT